MRPQFVPAGVIVGIEIDGIADVNGRCGSRIAAVWRNVSHLPRRQIGGVVRPQLSTVVSVVRSEIDGVTDEVRKGFVGVD